MTVTAGIDPSKAFYIKKYCPSVDILGLNVYGSIENAGYPEAFSNKIGGDIQKSPDPIKFDVVNQSDDELRLST